MSFIITYLGARLSWALSRWLVQLWLKSARVVLYGALFVPVQLTTMTLRVVGAIAQVAGLAPWFDDSLLVGLAVLAGWSFGLTTAANWLLGPAVRLPVFWLTLPFVVVMGWQAWRYRRAVCFAQRRTSTVLGRWRGGVFQVSQPYSLVQSERMKHLAIQGPTGSGKSTLLTNLIVSDITRGAGLCVIDPKDDLVDIVLGHIPAEREDDVVLLDATDVEQPLGFNPLSGIPAARRSLAASELIAVFRRSFSDAWGPRLEHILTNVILALLETPRATLLDIPRLLIDRQYGEWALSQVTNAAVREFFSVEYDQILRRRGDALEPILNKIGPWSTYPELRNIVGQPQSTFAVRQIMDRGGILLVRIPQGALGEAISNLLGALIVAKIQLAAHNRVDTPPDRRRPFYLYADEFQNFATSSFTRILAEARAFRLGLICANQYPEQLSRDLQLALSRNVATTVQCRHRDGRYQLELSRLEDTAADLPPLLVDPRRPLSAGSALRRARIRAKSRERFGRPRELVEHELGSRPTPSFGASRGRPSPLSTGTGRDIDED